MGVLDTVTALYNDARTALVNKVFDLSSNTLTGTTAQFNTALSDADFMATGGALGTPSSGTLTNCTGLPLTGLVGASYSATGSASTLAQRDAQANLVADGFIPGSTSTVTAAGTTTLTVDSTQVQILTGSLAQTVQLPSTGVVAGQSFTIINRSTGNVTITSSDASTVTTIITLQSAVVTALQATPTVSTHWQFVRTFSIASTATASTIAQRDGNGLMLAVNFVPNLASTATAGATTTMSVSNSEVQVWTGATTQTITLPSSSVAQGQGYEFYNTSSGSLTINSSGGNLVKTLGAGSYSKIRAVQATPTTAAHWVAS